MSDYSLKWYGEAANKLVEKAVEKQVRKETEVLLDESNKKVPFKDGYLQASGDTDIEVKKGNVTGTVYYDTPYAVRLHEHPEYSFGNGRQGKYLEDAFNSLLSVMNQRIADAVKIALKFL